MKPVALIIMDGLGVGKDYAGNAVLHAKTPVLDRLWTRADKKFLLGASGPEVGLPLGVPGNSEVGHINMGAGRVVYQMISAIDDAVASGAFAKNTIVLRALQDAKSNKRTLHIVGLLSASGVHADVRHLFALLDICAHNGVEPVLHIITDGRDTPRFEAGFYLKKLREKMFQYGFKRIGSITGRFYAMDRNNMWDRTQLAYNAMIGSGVQKEREPEVALEKAYARKEDDETLQPTTIVAADGNPIGPVKNGDVMIFYNFREDRARQLTKAFVLPKDQVSDFDRPVTIDRFIAMSGYEEGLPIDVLFKSDEKYEPFSTILSKNGKKQFHIAETEKYAHVTYFFNGGREETVPGEEFKLIQSPKVADYSEVPEMSAYQVTEELLARIKMQQDDFFLVNFANPDMVGHTGKIAATSRAVEVTERCVYFVIKELLAQGGQVILTADHGNAELKVNSLTGEPAKDHTVNLVPCMYLANPGIFDDGKWQDAVSLQRLEMNTVALEKNGILADITPTLLKMMGMPIPSGMTAQSLL